MSLAKALDIKTNQLQQYLKLSLSFLRRRNPVNDIKIRIEAYIKGFLTFHKKLKIAKYRVNHLKYRVHQMETIIEGNNPTSLKSGKSLNLLR